MLLFLFCINVSCKDKFKHSTNLSKVKQSRDSIILINELSTDETVNLYNIGMYESDIFPISFSGHLPTKRSLFVDEPLFLLSADLGTAYVINPGEKVIVKADSFKQAVLSIEYNSKRTHELSFFHDLNKNILKPSVDKAKITSKKDFIKADSILTLWLSGSVKYIQRQRKLHLLSLSFSKICEKYLYYERTAIMLKLIYNLPESEKFIEGTRYEKFIECDSCLAMPNYRFASFFFNRIKTTSQKSSKSFQIEFDSANNTFQGDTKKQLLYILLNNYLNSSVNSGEFSQRIKLFFNKYPNDTLSKILKYNYSTHLQAYQSIHNGSTFDDKLISYNGKLEKWGDILAAHKGKVIIIDFWAMYCAPCIFEIPFSQKLEREFTNQNIVFIYISFDTSKATWLEGMKGLNLKNDNSYLRVITSVSGIGKYYDVKTIPKYVIYNKQGHLAYKDAPRPDDSKLKQILLKLIDNK